MAKGVASLTRGTDVQSEYPTLHTWVTRARPDLDLAAAMAEDALVNVAAEEAALARFLNLAGFVPGLTDGVRVLALLALEITLRSVGGNKPDSRVPELASILAGCLDPRATASKALLVLIADHRTLAGVNRAVESWAAPEQRQHKTFGRIWFEGGLGSTVAALLAEAQLRRRRLAASPDAWLRGHIAADALSGPLDSDDPANGDDSADVTFKQLEGTAPESEEDARAEAEIVWRRSYLDLVADPDRVLPRRLAHRLVVSAFNAFEREVAQLDRYEAERLVGLLIVAATGIDEAELVSIVVGQRPTRDVPWVLDLSRGAMLRIEARQRRKSEDGLAENAWLETGGPVHFPIAPGLLEAICRLARAGGIKSPAEGSPVLPKLRDAVAAGKSPELRQLMNSLVPGLSVSPKMLRARIAARLAHRLGPEVAQLALGDAFGLSAVVVSYSRTGTAAIAREVWSAAAPLFGESSAQLPPSFITPCHYVGSRFAPRSELLRAWALGLRAQRDRHARNELRDPALLWRAQATLLANLLMAMTGHRPTRGIGTLTLYDFVPEYGLATLGDKLSDPAHLVRVSALGGRLLIELKRYVDLLVRVSRRATLGPMADLARQVLLGETPLFSLPGHGPESAPLSAREMRETMPAQLAPVFNALRHHLNQSLQAEGVDPELRHAQLGWQVTPCHAMADASPLSAVAMARKLKDPLDMLACSDGWVAASARESWDWEGVPLPPLVDWQVAESSAKHEHQRLTRQLVTGYQERSEKCRSQLWDPLCRLIQEILVGVKVDRSRRRLIADPKSNDTGALAVTADTAAIIVERACSQMDDPIAQVVARQELVRLLRAGHRDRVVTGHIPRYLRPSFHTLPPPFVRGSGLAVRHVHLLRQAIEVRITSGQWAANQHETGLLFLMSVLLSSTYRSLAQALDIAKGLGHLVYSESQSHLVRIPSAVKPDAHYVLGGDLAVLALRVARLRVSRWPGVDELAVWVRREAPELVPPGLSHQATMERVASAARTAARLELNGPERSLLIQTDPGLSVDARTAVAAVEHWPAETAQAAEAPIEGSVGHVSNFVRQAGHRARRTGGRTAVDEIIRILNSSLAQTLPRTGVKFLDGQIGWSAKVERELTLLVAEISESRSTPALIGRYALHLLREGGRQKRNLADATPHTMVARFANRLHALAQGQPLADLEEEAIEQLYLATVVRASAEIARPRKLFDALRSFHSYLIHHEGAPEVDWALAAERAGLPITTGEAGLLRDSEIALVDQQLVEDIAAAENDVTIDPRERRLRSLRRLAFLILEASGIRPASMHGLTYGDLHLGDVVDYVHVRSTGRYGSAKTPTSRGFVPLEGTLWSQCYEWVATWVASEQSRLGLRFSLDLPVFGQMDAPRQREVRPWLLGHCNELLRWATGNQKARTYWLRKTRITRRHSYVMAMAERAHARHIHAALALSGHASVLTPLHSYISDPAVPRWQQGRLRCEVGRGALISLSGLKPITLDMAWQRAGHAIGALDEMGRIGEVLRRLDGARSDKAQVAWAAASTPPAVTSLYRGLRLKDVESYLLDVACNGMEEDRSVRLGLAHEQVERLAAALNEWEERTGASTRRDAGMRLIQLPRAFAALDDLRSTLMSDQPSLHLAEAARYWAPSASRVRPSLGLALPVTAEREWVTSWLESLGLQVHVEWHQGVPVLRAALTSTSATSLLQWTLMCTWLHRHVAASAE